MPNPATTVLLPHALEGNIYVRELGSGYRAAGCQVVYGADNLFEQTVRADVLHLHWPEAFYRWTGHGPLEARVDRFIATIDACKAQGARVVWTIHNTAPHEHPDNPLDRDVYQQVLDRADLLAHHCPLSQAELATRYRVPDTVAHAVIPHGHYLGYPHGITRDEARLRLGIPQDAYVYLQFGMIRGYKGLGTLLEAWRRVREPRKWLLVAGKYQPPTGPYAWREKLRMWLAARTARISLHLRSVPQEEVQVYLAAADAMVLTHSRGLNSGVAILGMTFGNLVIGPRLGCIEWVLGQGRNLIYPTGDMEALVAAMEEAPRQDAVAAAATNQSVAAGWRWEDMARTILDHPAMGLGGQP
ncbi:MAG: glycosyltransferase [Pseudomonadales bacterium]|nr:glycosyltransferase [Pseudomonadales bacterium]